MKLIAQVRKALVAAAVLALNPAAFAQPQDLGEGSLQVVDAGTDTRRILPLKHTEVKAEISGLVAEVRVTQVFSNPADGPIEAVYVFPLPENAAVNEMTLTVADRVIKGQIKKREEARQIYEKARAEGRTAALLDQERPNIFTQSVANIPPGHEIRVTLKYIQDLAYDHGEYKFVFPMTVGPRYIPGEKTGKTGDGWSDDTDQVPDASRITPPVVKPGERSGRDISVEVRLDAGVPVRNIRSSSHEITVKSGGPAKAEITLAPEDRIPNKDFLLTYEPEVKMAAAAVIAHKDGKEGYLTLMLQPGADFPLTQVTPKELVLALDVSGSMSGFPVETAKETALRCLEGMNPGDTFQIMSFASGNQLYFEKPLKNTPLNVARGRAVINGLNGGGGTEMLDALRNALEFPKDPERLRIVLFMTDGYIGDEARILAFIKEHLNNSRIFPLGVGSSPNRYLLEEMAVMGKGTVQYVRQDGKPAKLEKVIERFYDRISRPVLTDLSVDWNGLDVSDVSPGFIPDLFAGQPLLIHARYEKSGSAPVLLKGKMMGKPWKMSVNVNLAEKEPGNGAMGPLWARSRITELERLSYRKEDPDARERIIQLALAHKLVTRYTSFVAVDESSAPAKGKKPMVVPVESELPEGTRYEGFFGAGLSGSSAASARGAFAQAKFASANVPAPAGNGTGSGGGFAASPWQGNAKPGAKGPEAPAAGENLVAGLAGELLAAPSPRLLRKLVSLQDSSGAFCEPDGRKASAADQALALLALAKAKSVLGSDADAALQKVWGFLRGISPAGLNGREAVIKALKGSRHWTSGGVQRELAALSAVLEKLK
ncbi:MAG: VIT domain-containing protein [Elusimicrobia bacterium]|nr:VIT domain-containing protein [Elusimicrobiota bacterium]